MTRSIIPPIELRKVLGILKMWREIRHQLRDKEDDALYGGYCTDFEARSRSSVPSNPTQARAIRLATDPETRQLQRLNGALERALMRIGGQAGKDSPALRAMREHYLGGQPREKIAKRLGVNRTTIWRWEQRFRVYVWEQLGRQA